MSGFLFVPDGIMTSSPSFIVIMHNATTFDIKTKKKTGNKKRKKKYKRKKETKKNQGKLTGQNSQDFMKQ